MHLLDVFFPKYCVNCKVFGSYVCPNCFSRLSFDTHLICLMCGKASLDGVTHPICRKKNSIDGVFCAVSYNQVAKKLVYVFKYQPYVSDIQNTLIELCYESLIQKELFTKNLSSSALFVPIPLSPGKLKQRGYNQSRLLAKGLEKKINIPTVELLLRTKATKPQFGLHKEERKENVKNAFAIKEGYEKHINHSVFLVDDVLTTGATLVEAAKILKKKGFQKVWGVTFARD